MKHFFNENAVVQIQVEFLGTVTRQSVYSGELKSLSRFRFPKLCLLRITVACEVVKANSDCVEQKYACSLVIVALSQPRVDQIDDNVIVFN